MPSLIYLFLFFGIFFKNFNVLEKNHRSTHCPFTVGSKCLNRAQTDPVFMPNFDILFATYFFALVFISNVILKYDLLLLNSVPDRNAPLSLSPAGENGEEAIFKGIITAFPEGIKKTKKGE
jgi:hypothetical protein